MSGTFPSALLHLADQPIWIGWYWGPIWIKDGSDPGKMVPKLSADGKPKLTKVPCDAGGNNISFKDPAQWRTYAQPMDAVRNGVISGVGIAAAANEPVSGGSWLLMDIDHCRDPATGRIDDWAWGIVEAAQSYTEVSPSGRGLRIIGGSGGWDPAERSRLWDLGDEVRAMGLTCSGETFFSIMYATITFATLPGFDGLWNEGLGGLAATLPRRRDGTRESAGGVGGSSTIGTVHGKRTDAEAVHDPLAPVDVIRETLAALPNGGNSGEQSWRRWNLVGMQVFCATEGSDKGLAAWDEWSSQHPAHGDEDTCENRWEHWKTSSPPNSTGFGPLLIAAREAQRESGTGWTGGEKWAAGIISKRQAETLRVMGPVPEEGQGSASGGSGDAGGVADGCRVGGADGSGAFPRWSHEMLARRMVDMWGVEIRYVAAWGKWMRWHGVSADGVGGVWREDATLEARAMARATCVAAATEMPKLADKLLEAKTIRAVETLAPADRRIAATVDQWDTDPWLLNTPGGVLDLRIGGGTVLRASDRGAYMTKMTTVVPDFAGDCPLWNQFLIEVTNNDAELATYLGRMAGYCLTGDISEHALFFLFGTGGNGKGTFMNTLSWILGEDQYARNAGAETFTAGRGDRHLAELARLQGARMVVTTEVEEGKAWAEARIKMLTGGDSVTADFKNKDHFTFKPQFKLLISGNHKPRIRTVDEAIRRRMNLVPFEVKIAKVDKDFGDKLKAEGPAILAWIVRGCREWQRIGLAAPKAVTTATNLYLESEDTRMTWLKEQCVDLRQHPEREKWKVETRTETLFLSWRNWGTNMGEFIGNQRSFNEWLRQQGFEIGKNSLGQTIVKHLRVLVMGPVTNDKNTFGVYEGGKSDPAKEL